MEGCLYSMYWFYQGEGKGWRLICGILRCCFCSDGRYCTPRRGVGVEVLGFGGVTFVPLEEFTKTGFEGIVF